MISLYKVRELLYLRYFQLQVKDDLQHACVNKKNTMPCMTISLTFTVLLRMLYNVMLKLGIKLRYTKDNFAMSLSEIC